MVEPEPPADGPAAPTPDERAAPATPVGAPGTPVSGADATMPFATDGTPAAGEFGPGARIGRYQVRRVVGSGGIGLVLAAHDAELGREVAIKLLTREHAEARSRLVREAQAMARLSHPNVVTVHEVVRVGDRSGIVMELIDGQDLGTWCTMQPRTWRQIVGVYVDAARGLAAAHRAGLVHRDFKPSNALIDRDGIVRVTDFGLVQTSASDERASPGTAAARIDVDAPLTRTGVLLGTPAYMAPEQHRGEAVDARTDQWALACALYGALYGQRPFAGDSYSALSASVLEGTIQPEPADSRVPRAIRAALRRALARRPADRFPTMDDLIAALTPTRRAWQVVALGALALVAALVVVLATRDRGAVTCEGLDVPMDAVWSPARASELRARFAATQLDYAAVAADRVVAGLDRYRSTWIAARTSACTRARKGEASQALLDRRMRCLDHRLVEVSTLIDGLIAAEPKTMRDAGTAVDRLRPIGDCEDPVDTVARPTAAAARAELEAGETELARATALFELGHYDRARPLAQHVVDTGERLGWTPLVARGLLLRALCEGRMSANAEALVTLDRAAMVAAQARDDTALAEALSARFYTLGDPLGKPTDALASRPFVELALERAGQPAPVRALWLHNLAIVLLDAEQYDDALAAEVEAVALWRTLVPPGHFRLLDSLETQGNIHIYRTEYDRAKQLLHEVLDGWTTSRGPRHPEVADTLANLGVVEAQRGDLVASIDFTERGRAIALAAGVPVKWSTRYNLGAARLALGRWQAAAADFTAALEGAEAAAPGETRPVGHASVGLGAVLTALGELERARTVLERGLTAAKASAPPLVDDAVGRLALLAIARGDLAAARATLAAHTASATGASSLDLARAELARLGRDCTAARAAYERTIELATTEPTLENVTAATAGLGECRIAQGDAAGAVAALDARATWLDGVGAEPGGAARVRFALARALVAAGGDRARARTLAEAARAGFATLGAPGAARAAEVDRWLATR
jgi:tetratricopeptide (TPR) repeat protein